MAGTLAQRLNRMVWLSVCMTAIAPLVLAGQDRPKQAEEEWKKLDEMQKTISAPEYVGRNLDSDLAAVKNLSDYRKHLESVQKEFASEIKSDNQPYRNLGIAIRFVGSRLDDFERAAKVYGSLESVQADIEHARMMAKRGVENQAPAYFREGNDISNRMEAAKIRIEYLKALDPSGAGLSKARQAYEEATKEIEKLKAGLSTAILAQNELPPDNYRGGDREALVQLVEKKWKENGNGKKVLKIGIVTSDWKRTVAWEIQNRTLYKVDQSKIQAYVIAANDAQTAARHSINLVKDHLSSDSLSASFLNNPKDKVELSDQILLSKIK